ncbi:MAG: hypothetical protein JW889_08310 [Verrucomicrobia bacterium]|nr:hypothetical protein [Verrucomicrobiota bacterium]
MLAKALVRILCLSMLCAVQASSHAARAAGQSGRLDLTGRAGLRYSAPIPIEDRVKAVETTELDIGSGEPQRIFQTPKQGVDTLIRTPSINPMFVRVELTEPITFEAVRLRVCDTQHTWTMAVADSMAELRAKSGMYRVILKGVVTPRGEVEVMLDKPVTARAMALDLERQGGDDYVHLWQWQFCLPGELDRTMTLQRIVNRREPDKTAPVKNKTVEVMAGTVVWFTAQGSAGGQPADIGDRIVWRAAGADAATGDGLTPFGREKGMFLVDKPGRFTVTARCADTFEESVAVVATSRPPLTNREPDVEILYIERLPRLDHPPADNKDPDAGWPAPGSNAVWRAHVYNWGTKPIPVTYRWTFDGSVVKQGTAVVPVGPPRLEATAFDLPWRWERVRHDLTFEVVPAGTAGDLIANNNTLTIQTDAITVGLWVEQGLWEYFHDYQHKLPLPDKANSFAGWAQRLMREWNGMFERAAYPGITPHGITERVRLDRLVVVPEFSLPLAGGLPSNNPDVRDKTVDIMWGFEAEGRPVTVLADDEYWSWRNVSRDWESGRIQNHQADPPFGIGRGYMHEMCHARYLIDSYGFNVHTGEGRDVSKRGIRITDENGPIAGRYWPWEIDIVHSSKYPGIMSSAYWYFSPYDAMCYERVRGTRARGGNCNSPPRIGEFLNDLPKEIIYQYEDQDGRPLAGAEVWVYQAEGNGLSWYGKVFDNVPDIKTITDDKGQAVFEGKTLFSPDGHIAHTFGISQGVVIIRITQGDKHYFIFEECTDPNIACNTGHKDRAVFRRTITLRTAAEPDPTAWDPSNTWEPKQASSDDTLKQ